MNRERHRRYSFRYFLQLLRLLLREFAGFQDAEGALLFVVARGEFRVDDSTPPSGVRLIVH